MKGLNLAAEPSATVMPVGEPLTKRQSAPIQISAPPSSATSANQVFLQHTLACLGTARHYLNDHAQTELSLACSQAPVLVTLPWNLRKPSASATTATQQRYLRSPEHESSLHSLPAAPLAPPAHKAPLPISHSRDAAVRHSAHDPHVAPKTHKSKHTACTHTSRRSRRCHRTLGRHKAPAAAATRNS